MRIIFFGTPELCVPYLDLLHSTHTVVAVISNPNKPAGRHQKITPTPTAQWAERHDIPCLQPDTLKDFSENLTQYNADVYIVVAYGKIIPNVIINQSQYGTLNVHYSLLPRWRGACPVESTILNDDRTTGVCIQQMRYKLDSGPILASNQIDLLGDEYARDLRDNSMGDIGRKLLSEVLVQIESKTTRPIEQSEDGITMCYRIQKSDGELLETDTDTIRWQKYRAYKPWPGVFYFDSNNKRVKILEADYIDGKFIIISSVREGEKIG